MSDEKEKAFAALKEKYSEMQDLTLQNLNPLDTARTLSVSDLLDLIKEKQATAEQERFLARFNNNDDVPEKVVEISHYWRDRRPKHNQA